MASEFYFDLKKATIFQAVEWERYPVFRWSQPLKKLFRILFIFALILFLYGFLGENFSRNLNSKLLGLSIIFLDLTLICWLQESFFNLKLKQPKISLKIEEAILEPEKFNRAHKNLCAPVNLAEFLSFEVAKAVFKSIEWIHSKNLSKIDSSVLLYFLLRDNQKLNFVFSRALLNLREIEKILAETFKTIKRERSKKLKFLLHLRPSGGSVFKEAFSDNFQNSILESLKIAQKRGHLRIEIGDVILALAKHDLIFKQILINSNLKFDDIENLVCWLEDLERKIAERKRFWEWKNLLKMGSLAKEWTAGYTVLLDQFSVDVTELMKRQGFREIFAHKKEVETLERILARTEKNNVLIIGPSGSARRSMIEALANRCALGESLAELNYKRVVMLDLPKILAVTENTEEAEEILDKIFEEAVSSGNVILVIDNFHNFIGVETERRAGIVEISGTLSSYLTLPSFRFIGITTFEGLHRNIEQNSSLLELFEKVEVSEISEEETLVILKDRALRFEGKYKIIVSLPALRDIISLTAKYLPALPFPEKAMGLLDEAMVYVAQRKLKIILPEHIAKIITGKTQIPVGEIETKEKEILLNLENLIHQRIINQEEAVKEVSAALKRARAQVIIRKGPIGSFLFLGPTGVGKTETSKALTEIYFGSEEKMIRLDMSEFQNIGDIPRLIGSPGQEGLLTTKVRENPFSSILLDEFEKAHPNLLNLFLQVLDEGHLTDGLGRKVDFKNTIIIATSNAGYQIILQALKDYNPPTASEVPAEGRRVEGGSESHSPEGERAPKTEWSKVKEKLLDFVFEKGIFRPELINRFDGVIVFRPLTKENLLDIAELLLKKIKKQLSEKEIDFVITQPLKEKIVELSYDPTFGARNMQRVIQDKVGNVLATAILSDQIKRGNRVEVDPEGFKLKINPRGNT